MQALKYLKLYTKAGSLSNPWQSCYIVATYYLRRGRRDVKLHLYVVRTSVRGCLPRRSELCSAWSQLKKIISIYIANIKFIEGLLWRMKSKIDSRTTVVHNRLADTDYHICGYFKRVFLKWNTWMNSSKDLQLGMGCNIYVQKWRSPSFDRPREIRLSLSVLVRSSPPIYMYVSI